MPNCSEICICKNKQKKTKMEIRQQKLHVSNSKYKVNHMANFSNDTSEFFKLKRHVLQGSFVTKMNLQQLQICQYYVS